MAEAVWRNGKRTVRGSWEYYWPGDFFKIHLATKDRRLRHLAIVLGLGATLCFVIGPSL